MEKQKYGVKPSKSRDQWFVVDKANRKSILMVCYSQESAIKKCAEMEELSNKTGAKDE